MSRRGMETEHARETQRGTFVREVREAIHGGFQRYYIEQLNEIAKLHGLPIYEIPDDWGHCQHDATLRNWAGQIAPALRAMDAMADPERQGAEPPEGQYRGRGKVRGTKGGWAKLGGGGRKMAETLHRIAAQGVINLYNTLQDFEPLSSADVIREKAWQERPTDVRAAQAIEDGLGPQQVELEMKPQTRRGARTR